jgi:hypothetical protein
MPVKKIKKEKSGEQISSLMIWPKTYPCLFKNFNIHSILAAGEFGGLEVKIVLFFYFVISEIVEHSTDISSKPRQSRN